MEVHGDYLIFDSGTRVYAHGGIVGIDAHMEVTEGYDSSVRLGDLTRAERCELASYMVTLWTRFLQRQEYTG